MLNVHLPCRYFYLEHYAPENNTIGFASERAVRAQRQGHCACAIDTENGVSSNRH
jgi:hypothetical protein